MLQLGLTGMAEAMQEQMDLAGAEELGFDDRLAMLLERELGHRNQRSYLAHLRRAQLRMRADLQDVDCRAGRGISRTVLTQLGAGDWIRNAHNLAVYGPAGCGKSFLLCALAHQTRGGSCPPQGHAAARQAAQPPAARRTPCSR